MQQHLVHGCVIFPLIFPITCETYESAVKHALDVLNNQSVLKVEMDVYTSDGKKHLIICDESKWSWKIKSE